MNIQHQHSLQSLHTFGCDIQSQYYARLTDTKQLPTLMQQPCYHHNPKLVLGSGSNLLFSDHYSGLIIHNCIQHLQVLQQNSQHVWLRIGAGENWHQLVCYCVQHGFHGLENLSLIPGTVGAAPMQNIGAYGAELKHVFDHLEAIHLDSGKIQRFDHQDCAFGYRDSIFKNSLKNQYLITQVTLKLNLKPHFNLSYATLRDHLEQHDIQPSLYNISQAVIAIRNSKLPDPAILPNAGSFFKNPIVSQAVFDTIQQQHPRAPQFIAGPNTIKIPAAWLIEQCGFKGKRVGAVGVHDKQAVVLIKYHNGNGQEVQALAQAIQQHVQQRFHISLEYEVNII